MSYFIINVEHDAIVGVTDVPYASFTNRFVEATEDQVAKYETLSAALPEDVYLELADLQPKQKRLEDNPIVKATPATKRAIHTLMRLSEQKQRKNLY